MFSATARIAVSWTGCRPKASHPFRWMHKVDVSDLAAIILAAGKSTRMKSDLPKVLHRVCGRPMLSYALGACRLAGVERLYVVVGHGKDEVMTEFAGADDITWVDQSEQKGTGHAVLCCREAMVGVEGSALVLAGDMPLIRRHTLAGLHEARSQSNIACTIATTELDDPTGYGRIVRDENGQLTTIVEHADCTPEQRAICEVNPSYYCFDAEALWWALDQTTPQGPKGEYYVTDAIRILGDAGKGVAAPLKVPSEEATGVNSRLDLTKVGRLLQDRIQRTWLEEGVTIVDPDNTWIEADAMIGRDTVIYPFSFIGAGAVIGEGCRIGPFGHVPADETVPVGAAVGLGAIMGAEAAS